MQNDWDVLAKSIAPRQDSIDTAELLNIKYFFKQLANEYYDMDLLLSSINDPTKRAEAKALAKSFRENIRACDDAASDSNVKKILEIYPKSANQLKTFFLLLQDVPDEL